MELQRSFEAKQSENLQQRRLGPRRFEARKSRRLVSSLSMFGSIFIRFQCDSSFFQWISRPFEGRSLDARRFFRFGDLEMLFEGLRGKQSERIAEHFESHAQELEAIHARMELVEEG